MASAMKESGPQPGKTSGEATEPAEQQSPYSLFRPWEKAFIISMTTVAGLASPLSSQIYYPALPILAQHYEKTMTLVNLTITTYMIVQGLAPSFVSTYADVGGRRPAYILAFTIYVGANLGLALQNSFGALMALRCLQSAGSSATFSLGYGVAADIASSGERGRYMGWMNAGFMAALPLGPVLGGVFVRWLGWRSIFWFLVVASGSFLVIYLVVMPETSRKLVGNGSLRPSSPLNMSLLQYICSYRGSTPDKSRYRFTWQFGAFNPLRSLAVFRDKSASITISALGAMYALNIIFAASTANLFGSLYGLDSLGVGLCLLCARSCHPYIICLCKLIVADHSFLLSFLQSGPSGSLDVSDPPSWGFLQTGTIDGLLASVDNPPGTKVERILVNSLLKERVYRSSFRWWLWLLLAQSPMAGS